MTGFSLSNLLKFLIGILLMQAATAILVVVALRMENQEVWFLLTLIGLALGLTTAFWFASMVSHAQKEATAQIKEGFSREREKIRLRAEREKSKLMEKNHQRIIKDRDRSQVKSNIRSGTLLVGIVALGGILAFTQFFTFGLLLMTTAGGGLAGYLLRSRQLLPGRKQKQAVESPPTHKNLPGRLNKGGYSG